MMKNIEIFQKQFFQEFIDEFNGKCIVELKLGKITTFKSLFPTLAFKSSQNKNFAKYVYRTPSRMFEIEILQLMHYKWFICHQIVSLNLI